jgi:5-formyltetrahydrofolate cyclo-ligase
VADEFAEKKAAIREQARKNRLAVKDKDAVSRKILARFMAQPAYAAANTIMFYVDAGSEVRTRHVLPDLLGTGKRVVIPYCITETNELELFVLEDMAELTEGAHKILEPHSDLRHLAGKQVQPEDLDLVLVPGTAFDPRGARMGQGKGYYDRLLSRVRKETPLIAIAFEGQIFDEIPVAPHDVFMDLVITENRTIKGKGRG